MFSRARARISGVCFPWNDSVQKLKEQNAFGDALEIHCQIHGTKCEVRTKDDFLAKVPEGGCFAIRKKPLQSGHLCSRVCHIRIENMNRMLCQRICNEKCNRVCACGHRCLANCHYPKPCGNCVVPVEKLRPECRHTVRIPCWQTPSSVYWTKKVPTKSPCGHTVTIECSDSKNQIILLSKCTESCNAVPKCVEGHRCPDPCHYPTPCEKCFVDVDKIRTECQHTVRVACWVDPSHFYCYNSCKRYRSCGHKCKGTCGAICDETICDETVEAESPCGHKVTINCFDATSDLKLLNNCSVLCNALLKCGHLCQGSCGRCKLGRLHIR